MAPPIGSPVRYQIQIILIRFKSIFLKHYVRRFLQSLCDGYTVHTVLIQHSHCGENKPFLFYFIFLYQCVQNGFMWFEKGKYNVGWVTARRLWVVQSLHSLA